MKSHCVSQCFQGTKKHISQGIGVVEIPAVEGQKFFALHSFLRYSSTLMHSLVDVFGSRQSQWLFKNKTQQVHILKYRVE